MFLLPRTLRQRWISAALARPIGSALPLSADEAQLSAQFDFLLEEKILVEAPR